MEKLLAWIDDRFPLTKVWEEHLSKYYAPKNFNFWYYFGSLALVVLVIALIRMLDVYLPGEVWSAYLLLGVVFSVLGLLVVNGFASMFAYASHYRARLPTATHAHSIWTAIEGYNRLIAKD